MVKDDEPWVAHQKKSIAEPHLTKKDKNQNQKEWQDKKETASDLGKIVGQERVQAIPEEERKDPDEALEGLMENFPQSAEFANSTAPRIRELAGCKDASGAGTFTDCDEEALEKEDKLWDEFWDAANRQIEEEFEEEIPPEFASKEHMRESRLARKKEFGY